MNDVIDFIKMSKYAGERFDLVQAGGGNTSVKLNNGQMLIKASGFLLSDLDINKGYTSLDHKKVIAVLGNPKLLKLTEKREREAYSGQLLNEALLDKNIRPSIETFLHSLLYKFTLHTHPIVVNALTCKKEWRSLLASLFGQKALYVDYQTPGIELAYEMLSKLNEYNDKYNKDPHIIFLQNHGLIISASSLEEVKDINEQVITRLEKYFGVDNEAYRHANVISELVNSVDKTLFIAYLSKDNDIINLSTKLDHLSFMPFCPDGYVFCGASVLVLESIEDNLEIINYMENYHELPKVIYYQGMTFFIALNIKKAKEMEEVFKFQLLTIDLAGDSINVLDSDEIRYLGNWEAEKYRQKL